MHDVTRELCLREARNMNFVNVIKRNNDQNPCEQEPMHFSSKSRAPSTTRGSLINRCSFIDIWDVTTCGVIIENPPSAQMKTMELMENLLPEDVVPDLILLPPYAFPQNLKKLTFSSKTLQWKDLSILSKLPKLEALKLVHNACKGEGWEVVEGFPHLKFLRASCDQFPCHERLFLERCVALDSDPQDYTCSN
ncbi:hypothetical protein RDI58_029532 [Solanum bulbocastanum]|uniref:Uncharacterized protein n=1 Tax=Solanum bulbocastanum TaxID=147425 RepID=A0AAN8SXQ9_SOLBU